MASHDAEPPVVIRDKRRIDPATGAAREPAAGPTREEGGAGARSATGAPAQDDARVAELIGDLQRLKAEYDNYRRRVERDRALAGELAVAGVFAALLPILDDIDRARAHGDLTGAFGAVGEALAAVTAKLGLEPFGNPGEPFDPTVHEALLHSVSPEVSEPTAVEVLRPGYRYAGRVLRAAQVAVAEPAPPPGAAPPEEENGGG